MAADTAQAIEVNDSFSILMLIRFSSLPMLMDNVSIDNSQSYLSMHCLCEIC